MSVLNLQKLRDGKKKGPNDHIGDPVDAPVGHHPRVVKVPMHDKADVNPKYHEAKEKEKKSKKPDVGFTGIVKGAGWNAKDERMYNHIKDSGASERIAAATVNKQRRKEGRTKMKPNLAKGGPGSGPKPGSAAHFAQQLDADRRPDVPKKPAAASIAKPSFAPGDPEYRAQQKVNATALSKKAHSASFEAATGGGKEAHHAAYEAHSAAHQAHTALGNIHEASTHLDRMGEHAFHAGIRKGLTGENMSTKNEVSDLFKAELGHVGHVSSSPVTNCVHCKHALTHDDLKKGLGPQFVADDNDNPHSGGDGQVEPSRPGSGVPEHDQIAPLLKSCKGPEAGDQEEYPISKSEMLQMGMEVGEMEDGWYTITKAEMHRVGADAHIGYLAGRKALIAKSVKKSVKHEPINKSDEDVKEPWHPSEIAKSNKRAGGVHGPQGEPLVIWEPGSDQAVAAYIEKSGQYGIGNDEPIRTQGNGGE